MVTCALCFNESCLNNAMDNAAVLVTVFSYFSQRGACFRRKLLRGIFLFCAFQIMWQVRNIIGIALTAYRYSVTLNFMGRILIWMAFWLQALQRESTSTVYQRPLRVFPKTRKCARLESTRFSGY